jgi:cytochrome c oxidase accessory protein FixG
VFLEGVYRRIERWFDGNAAQRKRLAEAPWNAHAIARRGGKWLAYGIVSMVLSHVFLSYFMPVGDVYRAMLRPPSEHPTAFVFVLVLTAIIWFDFAWFREQLCIVVCPYGRLQGVLYDPDTVNVGYDKSRGEPRGKYTNKERGDCIDCFRCVAVCPTGIDIRNGTQMECIGCANCIDACDEVMQKLGQPPGLVRYDSQRGFEAGARRFWRPRLALYAVLLLVGIVVFAIAASGRTPFEASVVRQQGVPFTVEEDVVQNAFVVHLVNKEPVARTYRLAGRPQPGVSFVLPVAQVELASLAARRLPFFVRVERAAFAPGLQVELEVQSDGPERTVSVPVLGPER